jgi:hypothetical protein
MVGTLGDRRRVDILPERGFDFGDYQMNYMNYRDWRIIPSSDVYIGEQHYYQSNRYGCQGPEIAEGRAVIGVFGDSVIHGAAGDSFVHHMRIEGYETLNAGIEGLILPWTADRFLELRGQAPIVCALVHTGWHNLLYNERGEDYWAAQLDRIEGVPLIGHFTLTADISETILEPGYASVVGVLEGYGLWHGADLGTEQGRRNVKAAIDQFNVFIRRYCRERGRVLIDLEPVMAPRSVAELGVRYVDFVHPSPKAYDLMAREIEAQLAPHMARAFDGAKAG